MTTLTNEGLLPLVEEYRNRPLLGFVSRDDLLKFAIFIVERTTPQPQSKELEEAVDKAIDNWSKVILRQEDRYLLKQSILSSLQPVIEGLKEERNGLTEKMESLKQNE